MFQESHWIAWLDSELRNYREVKKENGKTERKYLSKGYLHFDDRFWLPERKNELKNIVKNPSEVAHRAFLPFIKQIIKTPRFRYQDDTELYEFEVKPRPISYASHLDSLIFSFYSFCLTKQYEQFIRDGGFAEAVLAYRTDLGKCNIQFAKEVFDAIRGYGECTAIAIDIKGYFDNIDHKILKAKWQKVIGQPIPADQYKLYKTHTQYAYVAKNNLLKHFKIQFKKLKVKPSALIKIVPGQREFEKYEYLRKRGLLVIHNEPKKKTSRFAGIPQGSPMSALLSNIYLIDFDNLIYTKSQAEGFTYRRYCDDIIIVCKTEKAENLLSEIIQELSQKYLLEIQSKKMEIIDFKKNIKGQIRSFDRKKLNTADKIVLGTIDEKKYYKSLQYLGFEYNGKAIRLRSQSLSKYYIRMKARIIKTVSMAYGSSGRSNKIFIQKLLHRYSHLGKRNFIKYALNASKKIYYSPNGEPHEGMDSLAIRKQISRHMDILQKALEVKNIQRVNYKRKKQPNLVQKLTK